jgi:Domain of unknown function (DUF4410)
MLMKAVDLASLGLLVTLAVALFVLDAPIAATPASPRQISATSDKPPVYVCDFGLDVLPSNADHNTPALTPPPASQSGTKEAEEARKQASRLVDQMASNLVLALRKAGYNAVRLRPGDARPDHGLRIRGLFAEVDNQNHWRRAAIRSGSDTGKIQVLVSVADLNKPDQALYEIANLPGNANEPGAVITLSPYVPLATFALEKDAPEEAFQKTAARIVSDLTALLNANPAAGSL